jgi:hypothetical protein
VADEIDNRAEKTEAAETVTPATSPSSLPLTITLVALLLFFAFQTVQLVLERGNLSMVKSNQDAALQEAQKIEAQFKTLITKTNQLAEQGHTGARMAMEGLQRQGLGAPPQPESKAPSKAETKPAK